MFSERDPRPLDTPPGCAKPAAQGFQFPKSARGGGR
jgi:hypothetical protein